MVHTAAFLEEVISKLRLEEEVSEPDKGGTGGGGEAPVTRQGGSMLLRWDSQGRGLVTFPLTISSSTSPPHLLKLVTNISFVLFGLLSTSLYNSTFVLTALLQAYIFHITTPF